MTETANQSHQLNSTGGGSYPKDKPSSARAVAVLGRSPNLVAAIQDVTAGINHLTELLEYANLTSPI